MVGTMMSTNQDIVTTATAPPIFPLPPGASNNNNNGELAALVDLERTQKQIGLMRQQPAFIQAVLDGTITTKVEPSPDITQILQAIQAFQANTSFPGLSAIPFQLDPSAISTVFNPALVKEEPCKSSSSSPSSTSTAVSSSSSGTVISIPSLMNEPEYKPRNIREKVYADGFIMSFDKKSCCGTKYFWRCERKNDCNARMHSDIVTREIVRKLHPHNHEKPSPEELAFYEQDFSLLDPNYCHPVKSINRSYMQRKLSKASNVNPQMVQLCSQLPDPMEIDTKQFQQTNSLMLFGTIAAAAAASSGSSPPTIGQKRLSTNCVPIKMKSPRKNEEDSAESTITAEELRSVYDITKRIMKMMKPVTEIGVRWQGDQDALLIYLSHDNGAEDSVFFPVVVISKDTKSLMTAVEGFTGKRCEGKITLCLSPKVHILMHDALISNWTHGKLFLVNSNSPDFWRLTPVDAFGDILIQM
ncbi:unnamed protein product [Caenorhabditis nigoni]